jgi:hypothetical protein|tara:strand:- start:162 stop:584 length:423 start_codon:yes stop_codon:yes gene_type:complete
MATLSQIRDGLKTTVSNISGLRCYDTVPDNAINFPVAIFLPTSIEFDLAMQRGTDLYTFDLLVAVQRADSRTAQDKLDAYITGSGSSSVRQVIYNNKSLGLADTDARVVNVSNYAADVNLNGIDGVGANLEIQVYTKGSS